MREIARSNGTFTNRIYYTDTEGRLVERICHDMNAVEKSAEENRNMAHEFRPHSGGEMRRVGSIPHDVALALLHAAGLKGWIGNPEVDEFLWNIMRGNSDYSFLRTVPNNYRLGKYQ